MKIVKIKSILFAFGLVASFCSYAQITGTGTEVTKTIDLATITGIGLGINADVFVKQGAKQEITIKGQENIIGNIKTKVNNGTWRIEFDKKVRKHEKIEIKITLAELKNLAVGGSGEITGEGKFKNVNELDLSIGGSGEIEIDVDAKKITCSLGGSGELELAGSCNDLSISLSGSGEIKAYDLKAKRCTVNAAGSGEVKVNASEDLDVSLAGSGDISYKGNPKVNKSIVGSGDVEKAD